MKPEEWMKQLEQETAKAGGDVMKAIKNIEQRNADALITAAIQRSNGGETDWDALVHGLGRNDMPLLLMLVWDKLPNGQRIKGICEAWTAAEFPERLLNRDEWLEMFRAVGYLDEDKPGTPPESVTLWRGGVKKTRMSWTADRGQAELFAQRFNNIRQPGKLWTVTVGPDRLLAHFDEVHRHEDEYVIDPTGIRPKEIER
jgi:hypothetical protein